MATSTEPTAPTTTDEVSREERIRKLRQAAERKLCRVCARAMLAEARRIEETVSDVT